MVEERKYDTRFQTPESTGVDVHGLEKELRASIKGEVRFDKGSRALYSTDGSNYRQIPIGVVLPKSEEDIIKIVNLCGKYGAPVLARGGGTSLAGQCCNVAVVIDMSKYYNKILDFDYDSRTITVQPGIVLDEMRHFAETYGLTFGPDPATHNHCTIGGMLGNNSCGIHSVMAQFEGNGARMSDNVESMTILTYDGVKMKVGPTSDKDLKAILSAGGKQRDIYEKLMLLRSKYEHDIRTKFPDIPRRVSGYNLPELLPENGFNVARALVGSEGTCVLVLSATLKLIPKPKSRSLLVLGYPDVFGAGKHVPEIMQHQPIGLEGIDDKLIEYMKKKSLNIEDIPLLPEGNGWLLVEFGGDSKEDADNKAKAVMKELKSNKDAPSMKLYDNMEEEEKLWAIRESGLGATAWVPGEPPSFPGWEDSAVPPDKVGYYLRDLRELFHKYGYDPSLYGHFGQGCVHCRVGFDFSSEQGLSNYKSFTEEATRLIVKYGGSASGEHGDGQARGDLLEIMYGKDVVRAFHEFKTIWDPGWRMNPGKIVDTYGQLNNLRVGLAYKPQPVKTYFHYPEDGGSFAHAAMRCVGVGQCRRFEGGTMCPSFMATHEEEHSTRGRSRLLFEMMQGDFVHSPWNNEHVKEALDLCLSCKGCKGDCPVNVDMATYKAEFLSHYYKNKLRPRIAYFFGWIYWWSRIASPMAGVANFFTQAKPVSSIFKWVAGIAPKRSIPPFARETFRSWYASNKNGGANGKPKVILWTDTFNNFFLPKILESAARVLSVAGYDVVIPTQTLCCGRPLYDFGMLSTARKLLKKILQAMQDDIRAGVPVVGLEPSCVSVFRDELCNLLPDDEDAKRLKEQTYTLAEFLTSKAKNFKIPVFPRHALVHGHCHHKAIMKMEAEKKIFEKMKLDYTILDSGCCGMAGYFGYEKGRAYDVSVKAGEIGLLPKVREADTETLIIADGFSCRGQIQQQGGRTPLHLAELLEMALEQNHITTPVFSHTHEKVTA